jgi:hypothetical protein
VAEAVTDVLDGPRLKVLRAGRGLKELNDEIVAFSGTAPYEFVAFADAKTGDNIVQLRVYREPPAMLGIIVGEIVHNLRSALDHLACIVPLVQGARRPSRPQFPVYELGSPDAADPKRKCFTRDYKGRIGNVVPEAYNLIESVQPYHPTGDPGWHPLALLEDLWNWDKHNAINVVSAKFDAENVPPEMPANVVALGGPVHDCQILARWPKGGVTFGSERAEPYPEIRIAIQPAFGLGGPAEGLSLSATLPRLHEYVSREVMGPLERIIREAR